MNQTDLERIKIWQSGAREHLDRASIKDSREIHYVDKEDLMAAIGAAVCQERH